MKNLKLLLLTLAIGVALSLTARAETDAALQNILFPGLLLDDINECKATLNNLDKLIKLSEQLMDATQAKYNKNPDDPEAKAAYTAAENDYNNLTAWHERVSTRLMVEMHSMQKFVKPDQGAKNSRNASRDAANDAAGSARDASTDAARQAGSDAARGSTDHCPPKGGCH